MDKLLEKLTNKIKLEPSAEVYIKRANVYFLEQKYKDAILDFTSALSFEDCPNIVYYLRGGCFHKYGDNIKALEDLNVAVDLVNTPNVYYVRGDVYGSLKQYCKAINDYSQAIAMQKDFPSAYWKRGYCYCEMGKYSKAIEDYNKALETYSDNADLYNDRAFAYWQEVNKFFSSKNKLSNVIADFSKVIELNSKRQKAYTDRGHAYYQNKEYEKSNSDYETFINLKETNSGDKSYESYLSIAFAKGRIGVNQMKLKQFDNAIFNLEESIGNDQCASTFPFFLSSLAFCYFAKRAYRKALTLYIKAISHKISQILCYPLYIILDKFYNE
mgnify:FL=1